MKTSSNKQEVPACIYDDAEFALEIKKHTDKISDSQLMIGKLVWFYIQEHGNKYGDGTFAHIVEITGAGDSSIRNYYNLYRLTLDYKESPTLKNLGLGVKYEVARLLDHAEVNIADDPSNLDSTDDDKVDLVAQMLEKAATENLTRDEVRNEVSGIIQVMKDTAEQAKYIETKKCQKKEERENAIDPRIRFTTKELGMLDYAAESLKVLARKDVVMEDKIADALVDAKVIALTTGIIKYMERRVGEDQALNLRDCITGTRTKFATMCGRIGTIPIRL